VIWWPSRASTAIATLPSPPAAVIAPFDYVSMLYVSAIGYAVWGDVPDGALLVGAVIVAASGLYILRRETRWAASEPG